MEIIKNINVTKIQEIENFFFDDKGNFLLHPAQDVLRFEQIDLSVWCHGKGVYNIPTVELIEFLRSETTNQKAIEIGAGNGYLCKHLNITQTDSCLQQRPDIQATYAAMGQPIIQYPQYVRKFDAIEAVRRFKPQVVIGAWITQKSLTQEPQSNYWGVNEAAILKMVDKYIMIGHENQHNQKKILKYPHRIVKADWICSRSRERDKNIIYIWEK